MVLIKLKDMTAGLAALLQLRGPTTSATTTTTTSRLPNYNHNQLKLVHYKESIYQADFIFDFDFNKVSFLIFQLFVILVFLVQIVIFELLILVLFLINLIWKRRNYLLHHCHIRYRYVPRREIPRASVFTWHGLGASSPAMVTKPVATFICTATFAQYCFGYSTFTALSTVVPVTITSA